MHTVVQYVPYARPRPPRAAFSVVHAFHSLFVIVCELRGTARRAGRLVIYYPHAIEINYTSSTCLCSQGRVYVTQKSHVHLLSGRCRGS